MHLAFSDAASRQLRGPQSRLASTIGPLSFPSTDSFQLSITEAPTRHQVYGKYKDRMERTSSKEKLVLIMLHTYLHVLFPSEPNVSCCWFFDRHILNASLVVHDGLNARLVKHIRHQLVTGCVSRHCRHGQRSILPSVEVLHINANKDIISAMLYQCQIMRNVVPEALPIARSAPAASCLEITCPPNRVHRWR